MPHKQPINSLINEANLEQNVIEWDNLLKGYIRKNLIYAQQMYYEP